jgi:tetratricopeptide (TPR) repeat protein
MTLRRLSWAPWWGAALAVALTLGATLETPLAQAQDDPVARARAALALSKYELAEKELKGVKTRSLEVSYLTTRLHLWRGRYDDAAKSARAGARLGVAAKVKLAPWHAEALARQGQTDAAIKVLRAVESEKDAHRARLLLGELLIASGKRNEARSPLMDLVRAYNDDVISSNDAEGLSLVGRAAFLLRAYHDANDAFNEAEKVGAKKRTEALLWRAELFLDKFDPGHAAQVTNEAVKLAPNDPRVNVMMAHAKLAQAMDFASAEDLIDKALAVDPHLAAAHFVRAGLALRTMDIDAADKSVARGLKANPRDLELLSMKAAARFLAEDRPGFDAIERQVLAINPDYSRFYSIVAEFAEWEHRYEEIVTMMRKAVKVDPQDGKAFASLGLNLIRNGDDAGGVKQLTRAFKRDPFNVRAYNTLNLFEETIAKEYVTVDGTKFKIRYHKKEKRILERYVPRMLDEAWGSMVKRYGFTPAMPVGIELYADSQAFSIRTSGLPNIGIQGVCFGKTLAALSPSAGSFNWGMILWHELAHVFHIQMSKNRVPRWFTEGLAEYETIIRRPEWQREEHLALYNGLRHDKIPKVASFNRAFTHVDSAQDVVMAYFAASQISVFLAEEFGFDKVVAHLPGWGAGNRTVDIVPKILGISTDELDRRFRAWLKPRLTRYDKQFVPDLRPPKTLEIARKDVSDHPNDAGKLVKLALSLLQTGKIPEATSTLQLALRKNPKEPNALFLKLKLALGEEKGTEAKRLVKQLIANKNDGYAVRMRAADIAELDDDKDEMKKQFFKAFRFDSSQAEPLQALYDLANKSKDTQGQLWALRELAKLDQHDRRVWRRLLKMLLKRGKWEEARKVGESAIFVDVANPELHWLYGRALARTGRHVSAIYEMNSAIIAGAPPPLANKVYTSMAKGYSKMGKKAFADQATTYAEHMKAFSPKDGAVKDAGPGG